MGFSLNKIPVFFLSYHLLEKFLKIYTLKENCSYGNKKY